MKLNLSWPPGHNVWGQLYTDKQDTIYCCCVLITEVGVLPVSMYRKIYTNIGWIAGGAIEDA